MILNINDPETREALILGCKKNLERLKTCHFSEKEKEELRAIYQHQLDKYRAERMSFLKGPNQ